MCIPAHCGLPAGPGVPSSFLLWAESAYLRRDPPARTSQVSSAGLGPQVKPRLVAHRPQTRLPVTRQAHWLAGGWPRCHGGCFLAFSWATGILGVPGCWDLGLQGYWGPGVPGAKIWGSRGRDKGSKAAGVLGVQGASHTVPHLSPPCSPEHPVSPGPTYE